MLIFTMFSIHGPTDSSSYSPKRLSRKVRVEETSLDDKYGKNVNGTCLCGGIFVPSFPVFDPHSDVDTNFFPDPFQRDANQDFLVDITTCIYSMSNCNLPFPSLDSPSPPPPKTCTLGLPEKSGV